jgi:hypothetical protein
VTLFDAMPPKERRKYLDNWVRPGRIVYMDCTGFLVNKNYPWRLLVVTSMEPQNLMLMIGEDPHPITCVMSSRSPPARRQDLLRNTQ